MGHLLHLRIHHIIDMPGNSFARAKVNHIGLIDLAAALLVDRQDVLQERVVVIENAGVIQIFVEPRLDWLELAKVDYKAALV